MNRQLATHKLNGLNEAIHILVTDAPGAGGANHEYCLDWVYDRVAPPSDQRIVVRFQQGPINEFGVNGISNEALLAIVIDRLQGFQSGEFKCRENAIALTHLEDAMHWLQHRTRQRLARGVEGTSKV